jgi:proline iminopeptidase
VIRRLDDHLFPPSTACSVERLAVGDGHELHVEQAGNPNGVPMLLIHGGPGGASSVDAMRLIDPERFRVILFDQRGCGRSTPAGSVQGNTLAHTLQDMERLREHLGLAQWAVAGGSWGSTVALAYAEALPERVLGLLVTSVWLGRREDLDWWYYGVRTVFPEVWEQYAALIPDAERSDLKTAYHRRIFGDDPELAEAAAISQYAYENSFMYLEAPLGGINTDNAQTYSRIFSHYAVHDFFLEENQLLRDAERLRGVPTVIVGARYDMCTPFKNAYDLSRTLPEAELIVATLAGHYVTERALSVAVAQGVRRLSELLC